jgi:hypothetical protein
MSFTPEISSYEYITRPRGICGGKLVNRRKLKVWAKVSPGVDYDPATFLKEIDHYIHDPAGWKAKGFDFTLSEEKPDVTFCLVPDRPELFGLSLSHPEYGIVELNAKNYLNGVERTKLDLHGYRQYVVSHEMGHMLGCEHSNPHPHGQPVPVMHQQTRLGVEGFQPNNKVDPSVSRPSEG